MRSLLAGVVLLAFAAAPAHADDLIVRFEPGANASERAAARAAAGVARVESLPVPGLEVVRASGVPDHVIRRLRTLPGVRYVERDAPIRRHATPNDRFFGQQYALPLTGAPAAWDVTTGAPGVTVAVVDSGADLRHPDLAPNLWRNAREIGGNGRDDDRNGYVDDVHGYDFSQHDGSPQDADGHGTHVAGIIGANGNDGVGVSGVAWRASLLPLRVLDSEGGGTVSDAVKAYGYALRAGARVVNVSWGGSVRSQAERDMIADAPNVLFVASSGNEGVDTDHAPTYPCGHDLPNVVCVGASDKADALAPFSNRGARSVDLAAPGVEIASTIPGPDWAFDDGTSMAAPQVAGTAALMLARAPNATAAQLRSALLTSVDLEPGLAGVTATGGRLNVARAVQAIGAAAAGAADTAPPARSSRRADRKRPRVSVVSGTRTRARVRCSEACALRVELVAGHRVLARGRATRDRAGTALVRLRAVAGRRPGRRATLRVRATDRAGNVGRASRPVRLRR